MVSLRWDDVHIFSRSFQHLWVAKYPHITKNTNNLKWKVNIFRVQPYDFKASSTKERDTDTEKRKLFFSILDGTRGNIPMHLLRSMMRTHTSVLADKMSVIHGAREIPQEIKS